MEWSDLCSERLEWSQNKNKNKILKQHDEGEKGKKQTDRRTITKNGQKMKD